MNTKPWQECGSALITDAQKRMLNDLNYEPETGLFRWSRNGRGQTKRRGAIAGSPHSGGYVRIKTGGSTYFAHRLAWLFVHGRWPNDEIDHINRVRSDNRICNLREATVAENRRNSAGRPSRRKHSKFKGVCPESKSSKWVAKICVDGKVFVASKFTCEEDAAKAYRELAIKHHGEFASW